MAAAMSHLPTSAKLGELLPLAASFYEHLAFQDMAPSQEAPPDEDDKLSPEEVQKAKRNFALRKIMGVEQNYSKLSLSIFADVPDWPASKERFLQASRVLLEGSDQVLLELDRAGGALVGLAGADSLGHFFEFMPAVDVNPPTAKENGSVRRWDVPIDCDTNLGQTDAPHFDRDWNLVGQAYNRFRLKVGQWTDDCSMALCLADSLLRSGVLAGRSSGPRDEDRRDDDPLEPAVGKRDAAGGRLIRAAGGSSCPRSAPPYDGSDLRCRFWHWWHSSYNNAFNQDKERASQLSVGLGGNIAESLRAISDVRRVEDVRPLVLDDIREEEEKVGREVQAEIANPFLADVTESRRATVVERIQERGRSMLARLEQRKTDSGNGSIMRLSPVPIRFCHSMEWCLEVAVLQSHATHPGSLAAFCSHLLAFLTARAIRRPSCEKDDIRSFLDNQIAEYQRVYLPRMLGEDTTPQNQNAVGRGDPFGGGSAAGPGQNGGAAASSSAGASGGAGPAVTSSADSSSPDRAEIAAREHVARRTFRALVEGRGHQNRAELNWNWRDGERLVIEASLEARGFSYNGHPVSAEYFGSFAPDGLAVALHSLYYTNSFSEAVRKCVNHLGDADSTGAVCGQLAGAFYGLENIPKGMRESVEKWDGGGEIELRAKLLYLMQWSV